MQVQRVATSMRQAQDAASIYPCMFDAVPFDLLTRTSSPVSTPTTAQPCYTHRRRNLNVCDCLRCDPTRVAKDVGGTSNPVSPSGGSREDPSGDPPKRGSGTPQKGGCRDTKQCKFWRVSSVLIQGTFCFLGFFGGSGGSDFGGVRGSTQAQK